MISALRERPFGGNVADYKRVVRAIDGVGDLQVYPTWNGGEIGRASCRERVCMFV